MENFIQVQVETKSLIADPDHPEPEFQIGSGPYDSDWHVLKVGGNEHLNCPTEQG